MATSIRHSFTGAAPMLINCVVYENGAKLADIPVADISD
jgi:hypothetical protein